jgi:O-acetylserine/cysteine efflux transporter
MSGIAALAYVVVVSTFFCYGTWYRLISRYPVSTVAPFTLLVPVVGIVTAWLARGEHPTRGELLGSLVALVGLGLALGVDELVARRRPPEPREIGTPERASAERPASAEHT